MKKVYLPEGMWYDFFSDKIHKGGQEYIIECPNDKLPLFVKGGAILVLQSQTQHSKEKHSGILELHVYKGIESSDFELYEDDGESYDYQNGNYLRRKITNDPIASKISISKSEGKYKSEFQKIRLYLHGYDSLKEVRVNGTMLIPAKEDYIFIEPVSNFDPFEDNADKSKVIKDLRYIEFESTSNDIDIDLR